jgi:hypothetical protein
MTPAKQGYVTIPLQVFEDVRKNLLEIKKQQAVDCYNGQEGYARALGKCNGNATIALAVLDIYWERAK